MSERTCPGYCCAAFSLPFDHTELALSTGAGHGHQRMIKDGVMIAAMTIPVTMEEASERILAAGGSIGPKGLDPDSNWFACRYWDSETGLCRNYEGRPEMCRTYPEASKDGCCEHGCGLCA